MPTLRILKLKRATEKRKISEKEIIELKSLKISRILMIINNLHRSGLFANFTSRENVGLEKNVKIFMKVAK